MIVATQDGRRLSSLLREPPSQATTCEVATECGVVRLERKLLRNHLGQITAWVGDDAAIDAVQTLDECEILESRVG